MTLFKSTESLEAYMKEAIIEAKKAYKLGEVPIGAVIVKNGEIIARSFNKKEIKKDPTSHAEIEVIKEATSKLNSWRLTDCDIYVTLEPCLMCSGAIYQSRIRRLVYGAKDIKMGMVESNLKVLDYDKLNHHVDVISGILEDECSELIKTFFKELRE
ncbi:tRNA adenosine(34) deaminase TadA [Helicovermis profundi]|uniref:tRNA-specific adenosine deaminase n=1 Tax=Helicovermis profundi TaxID=3065157 RepID=A0AAU9ELF7_9FIRM|nr:tRNA adenosine(34) deaminase TadA [Clostridia bacterium S502]